MVPFGNNGGPLSGYEGVIVTGVFSDGLAFGSDALAGTLVGDSGPSGLCFN